MANIRSVMAATSRSPRAAASRALATRRMSSKTSARLPGFSGVEPGAGGRPPRQGGLDVFERDGADLALHLGDDMCRRELSEPLRIDPVDRKRLSEQRARPSGGSRPRAGSRSSFGSVQTGSSPTSSGKSHSCERPTSVSANPSAPRSRSPRAGARRPSCRAVRPGCSRARPRLRGACSRARAITKSASERRFRYVTVHAPTGSCRESARRDAPRGGRRCGPRAGRPRPERRPAG